MGWKTGLNAPLGAPLIDPTTVHDSEDYPIGTIISGYDDTQGYGEFIFLPGVASCTEGDLVVYDLVPAAEATVLALTTTHDNSGRPVAVALGAVVAGKYGWFQITGVAIVNVAASFAAGNKVFMTTTAGTVDDAAVAGAQVLGAISSSAIGTPAAGQAYVTMNRAFLQGQIT